MASHSSVKIRVTYETYGSFFATIRIGELTDRLVDQLNPSVIPVEIWNSSLFARPQLSNRPVGTEDGAHGTIQLRLPPDNAPRCHLLPDRHPKIVATREFDV
jgi:hypothetical protein